MRRWRSALKRCLCQAAARSGSIRCAAVSLSPCPVTVLKRMVNLCGKVLFQAEQMSCRQFTKWLPKLTQIALYNSCTLMWLKPWKECRETLQPRETQTPASSEWTRFVGSVVFGWMNELSNFSNELNTNRLPIWTWCSSVPCWSPIVC